MSSLSATQADGYYVPPTYFASGQYKKKSRNQFAGSKGHNQYLQSGIVRFELPYDGFCEKCGAQVGKGTRFNAKKSKAGAYLTTPIYEFQTKCRICSDSEFVIRTNPQKRSFDYVSGIHMRAHEADFIEEGNQEDAEKLSGESSKQDKLSQIEKIAAGKRKAMTEHDALKSLIKINGETFGEDVTCNRKIRSNFRQDRREKKARLQGAKSLGWKEGMELISEERTEDVLTAKSTVFSNGKKTEAKKFRTLRTSSIFSSKTKRKTFTQHIPAPDGVSSLDISAGSHALRIPGPISQNIANASGKKIKKLILPNSGRSGNITVNDAPSSAMLDILSGYGSDSE